MIQQEDRKPSLTQKTELPPSEVSAWTGLVGLFGLALAFWVAFVLHNNTHPAVKAAEMLGITALIMIIFEAIRLGAHRDRVAQIKGRLRNGIRISSAHDFSYRLLGAMLTLAPFLLGYIALKEIMPQKYEPFLIGILLAIPPILIALALSFLFTPSSKDVYWQLGMVALRKRKLKDVSGLAEHWRQWMLKAFFLPFMFGITYGNVILLSFAIENFVFDLMRAFFLLHALVFVTDTIFGTIGYITTFRATDSHIRSTQKGVLGWVVCLICYPPLLFVLFSFANFQDSVTWEKWIGDAGFFAWIWAALLLLFEGLYVWATVIFGLRFSNLTHRGIITNGPYRYFKHPAYFAKNISWWLIFIPFVPVISLGVAAVNSLQLLFVNYIYYVRAKTEEGHLMEDERYRTYVAWIDKNGILPALRRAVTETAIVQFVSRLALPLQRRLSYAYEKYVPFKEVLRRLW